MEWTFDLSNIAACCYEKGISSGKSSTELQLMNVARVLMRSVKPLESGRKWTFKMWNKQQHGTMEWTVRKLLLWIIEEIPEWEIEEELYPFELLVWQVYDISYIFSDSQARLPTLVSFWILTN